MRARGSILRHRCRGARRRRGRRSDGGAARRSSRGLFRIPGITRDAEQRAVGDRLPAEFRCRGLADKDGALLSQQRDRGRVLWIGAGAGGAAAVAHAPVLDPDDILQRRRNAVDRRQRLTFLPPRLGSLGRRDGRLAVDQGEGVVGRVDRFGPVERCEVASTGDSSLDRLASGKLRALRRQMADASLKGFPGSLQPSRIYSF